MCLRLSLHGGYLSLLYAGEMRLAELVMIRISPVALVEHVLLYHHLLLQRRLRGRVSADDRDAKKPTRFYAGYMT